MKNIQKIQRCILIQIMRKAVVVFLLESHNPNLLGDDFASKQNCARYDSSGSHRSTPLIEEVGYPACALSICRLTAAKKVQRRARSGSI